jgi:hypothetical protein
MAIVVHIRTVNIFPVVVPSGEKGRVTMTDRNNVKGDGVMVRQSLELDDVAAYDYEDRHSSYEDDEDAVPLVGGAPRIPLTFTDDGADSRGCSPFYYVAALLIAVMVGAIMLVPAQSEPSRGHGQLQCELDVTSNTSWTTFLHTIGNSTNSRCDEPEGKPCECLNPLVGRKPLHNVEIWENTVAVNLDYIKNATNKRLDVVLVGDSITECWHGTRFGQPEPAYADNVGVYEQLFDLQKGADISGLALGVAVIDVRSCSIAFRTVKCHPHFNLRSGGYSLVPMTREVTSAKMKT